jgi:hypothetical protein
MISAALHSQNKQFGAALRYQTTQLFAGVLAIVPPTTSTCLLAVQL